MERKKYIDTAGWSWKIIFLLLVIDFILGFLLFIFINDIDIVSKIYLFMLIISISSTLIVFLIIEFLRLKLTMLLFLMKYKRKPRVFEFGFFFFSFLATFFTIFAAGLYNNPDKFYDYLQNNWYFMSLYGVGFACGWYHYILRLDY